MWFGNVAVKEFEWENQKETSNNENDPVHVKIAMKIVLRLPVYKQQHSQGKGHRR